MRSALVAVILAFSAAACEQRSSGRCEGFIGDLEVGLELDPDASSFNFVPDWRDDNLFVDISYGGGSLTIDSSWMHSPENSEGEHTIDLDALPDSSFWQSGLVHTWDAEFPSGDATPEVEWLQVYVDPSDTENSERLVGEFTYRWVDSTELTCGFDLAPR